MVGARSPGGLQRGDLNGDGLLDVVTANVLSNNIAVLLNDGDWTLPGPGGSPTLWFDPLVLDVLGKRASEVRFAPLTELLAE